MDKENSNKDQLKAKPMKTGWAKFSLFDHQVILTISVTIAVTLCIIKAIASYYTGSLSVLSAFIDSFLDILSSLMLFWALRFSNEPPDDNHRFGHQKAEPLAVLLQSIIIFISASLLFREIIFSSFHNHEIVNGYFAIAVLFISFLLSLFIVIIQTIAIKKHDKLILQADRAHYIGDIFMNGGLLISVWVALKWQVEYIDVVASLVAAAILFWGGIKIFKQSIPQLLDEELSETKSKVIIDIINQNKDIKGYHDFRTRKAGDKIFIQFHIEFDPNYTVLQAHDIVEKMEMDILQFLPNSEIFIHQDPYGHDNHDNHGI